MEDTVTIVECPRDAWQGLPLMIPAPLKAQYLRRLLDAGFTHIDAVSFVSPAAVPQMADSEQVLALLGLVAHAEIIAIVVNAKGAERAIATGAVSTLGFPYSISPLFLERNQHQTREQSLRTLETVAALARGAGLRVMAYVSMAFGNPYGETWDVAQVSRACAQLAELGVDQISLADTTGLASPQHIAETLSDVLSRHDGIELGIHLHARPREAGARIQAAFDAGCRRFDAAIGGLGGCPFAQDDLVGNVPTEVLIATLRERGARLPELRPLDALLEASAALARNFGASASRLGSKG